MGMSEMERRKGKVGNEKAAGEVFRAFLRWRKDIRGRSRAAMGIAGRSRMHPGGGKPPVPQVSW